MTDLRITKSVWQSACKCMTCGWFDLREPREELDEATRFDIEQAYEVERRARELYPGGEEIVPEGAESRVDATRRLLTSSSSPAFFRASFSHGAFVAEGQILVPEGDGWHLVRVKSSLADTPQRKPRKLNKFHDDLAYRVMVARAAGFSVIKSSLLLLSRDYRQGDAADRLFVRFDQSEEVDAILSDATTRMADTSAQLLADTQPTPRLVSACNTCGFFSTQCLGAGVELSVFEIPHLKGKKLESLSEEGIVALADVPADFKLTEKQEAARVAALAAEVTIDVEQLAAAVAGVTWPCHYLDFETVKTYLPLYPDREPHEQILTQFSLHHCDAPGNVVGHDEHLHADPAIDGERQLADVLIRALAQPGSVMVYSLGAERTWLTKLGKRFPELLESLESIIARLVDLEVFVKYVRHPEFRGSSSIKKVLPVLVPDLTYEGLDIADGLTAITRFARMARGEVPPSEIESTRAALLDYCRLDTLAMVKLHQRLIELASPA